MHFQGPDTLSGPFYIHLNALLEYAAWRVNDGIGLIQGILFECLT
jgi:hypothetical protein